ncbi:MAG: hypothetical protein LBB85_11755 [Dysgonamonadaceae bacterium]|jgi:hypothetical protein|nr:hypothetical protein [Dysgonamonadaceae bacterium]
MTTLKYAVLILLVNILCAPCLLIFNEQPESEPQKWWINLIGFAYTGILIFIIHKYIRHK